MNKKRSTNIFRLVGGGLSSARAPHLSETGDAEDCSIEGCGIDDLQTGAEIQANDSVFLQGSESVFVEDTNTSPADSSVSEDSCGKSPLPAKISRKRTSQIGFLPSQRFRSSVNNSLVESSLKNASSRSKQRRTSERRTSLLKRSVLPKGDGHKGDWLEKGIFRASNTRNASFRCAKALAPLLIEGEGAERRGSFSPFGLANLHLLKFPN